MRPFWITAATTLGLDQLTKLAVVHGLDLIDRHEIDVLPPFVNFRMAWNYGINFGLLAHGSDLVRWGLIAVALAISAWVVWWMRRESGNRKAELAGGLLVGGALGNVIDRVLYGAVADFLNMSCCGIENPYAFNVADIAIFAGALGLVIFAKGDATGKATDGKPRRKAR
ncbi:signal peptidase II [Rhodobacter calidifons]|uniref:Lipoprotein signal peptidase n=1 Tax=Rhodobacter calidifons TaxID=2715277 RepID=A0ABX0G3F5_9RHOB|nr:signal peptidase II [Rhodobacter calidifons]NHB75743.1 signal peptidase II [Rhodobacter calidifons]